MNIGRDDWIGLRVARYRDLAGMTQQQLADRVGISRPYVSAIENGLKPVTTRALLISLAEALGVAVVDLTMAPAHARTPDEATIHQAVPNIRAALDGAEDVPPIPVEQLGADVDRVMAARMACDYPTLAAMLAPVVARTLMLAEEGAAPGQALFARACVAASQSLRPLGYVDLAARFAERAQWAAAQAEEPAAMAAAEFARAQCSLAGGVRGLRARSRTLALRAADAVQSDTSDAGRTWYGMLHLHAALSAASLGQDADAMAHVEEAATMAQLVTSDPWRMDFGAANVGVWKVAVALESGDPGRAPEYARAVDQTQLRTVQRRAHLYTHLGRALYLRDETDAATRAFLEADRIAPSEVRSRPSVREIVGQMVRDTRRRAGSEALRDLAVKVGVDPLAPEA